ncbi:MAG: DUF2142 domain-containing protein [Chloroflexota bacterium]
MVDRTIEVQNHQRFSTIRAIARVKLKIGSLRFLVFLALLQGLVYMSVVPPWGIPDEPRHFAYVRAVWLEWLGQAVTDDAVDGPIIDSLRRHNWWVATNQDVPDRGPGNLDEIPFLRYGSAPARGNQPPLYYYLNALAIRLTGQTDVDAQLYIARLVSVVLGTLVVVVSYLAAGTLIPGSYGFRLYVGILTALVPQRAFLSAGVNNDNLAILAASLVFLAAVRIWFQGATRLRLVFIAAACVLAVASKATTYSILLIPGLMAFSLLLRHLRLHKALGGLVAVMLLSTALPFLAAMSISSCDVRAWSKSSPSLACTYVESQSPVAETAIRVSDQDGTAHRSVYQTLPAQVSDAMRGRAISFGAWVRSPTGPQNGYMQVYDGNLWHSHSFVAQDNWGFEAMEVVVPEDARGLMVNLNSTDGLPGSTGELYYAGLVFVEAELRSDYQIEGTQNGEFVLIGSQRLENLVANGKASATISRLEVLASRASERLGGATLVTALQYLFDPGNARPEIVQIYLKYLGVITDSFWGWFGWMQFRLPEVTYAVLTIGTAATFIATLASCLRGSHLGSRLTQSLVLSAFVVALAFLFAFIRQIPPHGIPQGRYALPVVAPFSVVLCIGARQMFRIGILSPFARPAALAAMVFLIALNLMSLAVILAGSP